MTLGTYLLLIIVPMLLGLWAQFRVKSAFGRYSQMRAHSNMSGADAAREVLSAAQIHDVEVVEINGMLGDHYDPAHKRLCLSTDVYRTPSVAALGIAAHEAGHAIQHARAYAPLKARMALVPVTMFASQLLPFIILGGFFFQIAGLIKLGVLVYGALAVFQLVTLPVEFDASRRAKIVLQEMGIITAGPEAVGVNRVLDAAALTYVAAFVAALGNLLYLLLIARGRD
jgi:Zn-dependent membrane protease YugP